MVVKMCHLQQSKFDLFTLAALLLLLLPLVHSTPVLARADNHVRGSNDEGGPDLTAALDYGTFRGAYSKQYNISYWKKIPFAAPPVGENRFRGPQPPINLTGTGMYDSSKPFDMCPQRTANGSEDCLYLGLYSRPWKVGQPLRPVVVVFYGGGFIRGSALFASLPPSAYPVLNVSASTDLVFVYPNYRTNAFGLLAGRQIVADPKSDTNAGLLDQRAAIAWANRYAAQFGGDPRNVSIWGQSAGGGSVVAQVIANQTFSPGGGGVFQKALASSPYWPKTYSASGGEAQWIYDTLASRTGCGSVANSLACLKRASVQSIRDASEFIAASHTHTTSSYTWAPVIDGKFLPRTLTQATAATGGAINSDFAFATYNTHEGENFLPDRVSSFDSWLAGFLPGLSKEQHDEVRQMYPQIGKTETLASYTTSQVRAGLVYRDVVLACPGYWMAGASKRGWLAEYTISPAKHASDTYWWNQVNSAQRTDPLIYQGFTGAFASFFMTGDPNTRKLTPSVAIAVPELLAGSSSSAPEEFVINSDGFDTAQLTQLKRRCDFWRTVAPSVLV
ncbi:carboxylesterase [Apodospora peruviana]|uniref:Carboxylic ester hydrolase n=1 Tax=Apodospora peruviana TaxID=516989 RepID=A0AAE0IRH1_9PEZI|nr:carboxylesterase [Apodospora peruviana]